MFYTFISIYNFSIFHRKTTFWFILLKRTLHSTSYMREKKNFRIANNYKHPTDLYVDIKHGKLTKLDSILNRQNSYKELIHIGVEVKSQRLTEQGEQQKATFHGLTKIIQRNSSDIRARIVENLMKKLENHQPQGHGWVIKRYWKHACRLFRKNTQYENLW